MSQCAECELLGLRLLVEEYSENNSTIALDILEMFIESNLHSLNIAISEVFED